MDLEGLHSFVAIAREKSISRAARSLHVTQPTLSTRIRKLEEGLGVALLERDWSGVELTKQGRYFLAYSVQFIQELSEATAVLHKTSTPEIESPLDVVTSVNRIKIGIEAMLLPMFMKPIVDVLHEHHPDLDCKFISRPSNLLLDLMDCEGLHLGICFGNTAKPSRNCVQLVMDELVLLHPYPSEEYPVICDDLSNMDVLRDKPFVLFDQSALMYYGSVTQHVFHRWFGKMPERFHVVDHMDVMIDIISAGHGYTFVSRSSVAHLMNRRLPIRVVGLGSKFPVLPINMVYDSKGMFARPVQLIVERIASIFAGAGAVQSI